MRLSKAKTIFVLGAFMIGLPLQVVHAKKKEISAGTAEERLISAAQSCDLVGVNALIASGVNVSATDAKGMDALSYASLNRKINVSNAISMFRSSARGGKGKNSRDRWWTLTCPAVVSALVGAGADPMKAAFYENPQLDESRPGAIALIRVEDDRQDKGQSDKIIGAMVDGIEGQLHSSRALGLGYPTLGLSDVRQKLRTSGLSAEETVAPSRIEACKALGTDSVLEASLEDYQSASIVIVSASGVRIRFVLTSCKTDQLLWRSDMNHALAEGWAVSLLAGNKVAQIINGETVSPPALSFPVYEGEEKGN